MHKHSCLQILKPKAAVLVGEEWCSHIVVDPSHPKLLIHPKLGAPLIGGYHQQMRVGTAKTRLSIPEVVSDHLSGAGAFQHGDPGSTTYRRHGYCAQLAKMFGELALAIMMW